MRIAIAFARRTANVEYRVILPARELARRGHVVLTPGDLSVERATNHGQRWDLVHMHQMIGDEPLALVRSLRARGVAVVWDTDDDIAAAPRSSRAYKRLGGRRGIARHFRSTVEMARAAHLMTTTNEHLADVYRDAGVEHVAVIENYVGSAERTRRRHPGVTIGCTAASEHRDDLKQLGIKRVLQDALKAHEFTRVVAVGIDLEIDDPRYTHYSHVPLEQLLELQARWDLGIAPLVDSRLNRSRSNVKLKEYAAAGAAWLASPIGPYAGMGEEQGGLLVHDHGWDAAVARLAADSTERLELAGRGRRWAKTQTIQQAGRRWETAFRQAIARARSEHRAGALSTGR